MTIVQQGSINTTALVVPDLYVQIVPPQNIVLNGVPSGVLGIVGSASWGPLNQPMIVGSYAQFVQTFGNLNNRKYDLGTQVATSTLQGAQNYRCVRVDDGTSAAATSTGVASCITFAALYTGSVGNGLSVVISAGTAATSWKVTVGLPGQAPEVYDNITGGTANATWNAMVNAINNGAGVLRGPSNLIVATIGSPATTAVAAATMPAFTGGIDGITTAATVATNLIGQDTVPRKGMYALRGQGCSIGVLADLDTSATWTTQAAFGLSEGVYMVCTGPSGDTIANATTVKQSAGLDSYAVKLMFGDWIYWADAVSGVTRLVSPQGFAAGRLANLSPENSSLNKPIYGIIGTQKSGLVVAQNSVYSSAELAVLFQQNIDVISNPQPGGSYWGCRLGHNSSSNPAISGDNYTRLTNYFASTLNAGMGLYLGAVINGTLFQRIRATLLSYFQACLGQGLLGSLDGSLPFGVVCDTSNNPQSRTALGYVQADVQVQYQGINEKFIVNMEGGTTVVIQKQTTPTGRTN